MATYLSLAGIAPQFLVKEIPAWVTIGSVAWANFQLAVARIETQEPGKTLSMTFSEVMVAAEAAPPTSEPVQAAILMDWAIASQIFAHPPVEPYDAETIEFARTAFNQQLNDLKAASELFETPMVSREEMALALLRKKYGNDVDFKRKNLRINTGIEIRHHIQYSMPYSMLDITMQGLKLGSHWEVMPGSQFDLAEFIQFTNSAEFNIPSEFNSAFEKVTNSYKEIKQNLIMNAMTNLSKEDRFLINYGKARFFKENSYRVSLIPFAPERLFHTSTTIQVQFEHGSNKQSYAFDTQNGTIRKIGTSPVNRRPEYISDEVTRFEEYFPDSQASTLNGARSTFYTSPNHFRNPRIAT